MAHWLATYRPGHEYETTVHGDYIRYLVEKTAAPLDFDVGARRYELREDQEFWEGRVPLDFEI